MPPRPPRSRLRRLARLLALVVAGAYGAWILGLVYLRFLPPLVTMVQLQRAAEAPFEPGPYHRRQTWVPLASLPAHVPHAVVAAEDARFFQHHGFDWQEVQAAREQAARTAKRRGTAAPRGASTITQQLVKNLFLTTHRSYLRKAIELTLTPLAELILGKQRILELYVNEVEWGPGVYGIEAAAQYHYHVAARRLTRDQAARLAALLPAPRTRKPRLMGWYADIIQGRMRQMGW